MRFSCCDARMVEPDPQNGSNTTSFVSVYARMNHAGSPTGNAAVCPVAVCDPANVGSLFDGNALPVPSASPGSAGVP